MDGKLARRRCARRCPSRHGAAQPPAPAMFESTTRTRPSTSLAHSTHSTVISNGSAWACAMLSSSRTSLSSRPCFRKAPALPSRSGNRIKAPSVTPSASFLTTTRMAINAGRSQGMQVDNGADMVLRHVAEAEGKPVEGLETLQLQLNMFNHLPAAAPALRTDRESRSAGRRAIATGPVARAWLTCSLHGSAATRAFSCKCSASSNAASPETYRMMFTERNARWADWIAARLQTPGTVFVAVGAGHLAGRTASSCASPRKGSNPSGSTDRPKLAFLSILP